MERRPDSNDKKESDQNNIDTMDPDRYISIVQNQGNNLMEHEEEKVDVKDENVDVFDFLDWGDDEAEAESESEAVFHQNNQMILKEEDRSIDELATLGSWRRILGAGVFSENLESQDRPNFSDGRNTDNLMDEEKVYEELMISNRMSNHNWTKLENER